MDKEIKHDIQVRYIEINGTTKCNESSSHSFLSNFIYTLNDCTEYLKFFDMLFSLEGIRVKNGYGYVNIGDTILYFKIPPHAYGISNFEFLTLSSEEFILITRSSNAIKISLPYNREPIKEFYPRLQSFFDIDSVLVYCSDCSRRKLLDNTITTTVSTASKKYKVSFEPYPDDFGIESKIITSDTSADDFLSLLDAIDSGKLNCHFAKIFESKE